MTTDLSLVTITDVNVQVQPYPIAHGEDIHGEHYAIDLSSVPAGLDSLPRSGEKWWVDRRFGRWMLAAKVITYTVEEGGDPLPSALVPPGCWIGWSGPGTIPAGWMAMNGAAISRTDYAALFSAIGTTYGVGNGTTTFNLPDFRGKTPLEKTDAGTGSTLGGSGGLTSTAGTATPSWQATRFIIKY